MQHQRHHRDVELRRRRSAALRACRCRNSTSSTPLEPRAGRLQHVGRAVDADHARDVRREQRAELPGAAARDRRRPASGRAGRAARAGETSAPKSSSRRSIPLPRRRRKKLLRLRSPPREHARQAPLVVIGPARRRDLLADERPEASRASVEIRRATCCSSGSCRRVATDTQPASASVFRWRLTVDCGSCSTAHSSDTVSSCRSSTSSIRQRSGSASVAMWSSIDPSAFPLDGDDLGWHSSVYPDYRLRSDLRQPASESRRLCPRGRFQPFRRDSEPSMCLERIDSKHLWIASDRKPSSRSPRSPSKSCWRWPTASSMATASCARSSGARSGAVTLHPGTLYRALARLLESGLIEELDDRPDPAHDDERRRYYRLTDARHRRRACRGRAARKPAGGRARPRSCWESAREAPRSFRVGAPRLSARVPPPLRRRDAADFERTLGTCTHQAPQALGHQHLRHPRHPRHLRHLDPERPRRTLGRDRPRPLLAQPPTASVRTVRETSHVLGHAPIRPATHDAAGAQDAARHVAHDPGARARHRRQQRHLRRRRQRAAEAAALRRAANGSSTCGATPSKQGRPRNTMSPANFRDFQQMNQTLDGLEGYFSFVTPFAMVDRRTDRGRRSASP